MEIGRFVADCFGGLNFEMSAGLCGGDCANRF